MLKAGLLPGLFISTSLTQAEFSGAFTNARVSFALFRVLRAEFNDKLPSYPDI